VCAAAVPRQGRPRRRRGRRIAHGIEAGGHAGQQLRRRGARPCSEQQDAPQVVLARAAERDGVDCGFTVRDAWRSGAEG
jgi:hypothetical protein